MATAKQFFHAGTQHSDLSLPRCGASLWPQGYSSGCSQAPPKAVLIRAGDYLLAPATTSMLHQRLVQAADDAVRTAGGAGPRTKRRTWPFDRRLPRNRARRHEHPPHVSSGYVVCLWHWTPALCRNVGLQFRQFGHARTKSVCPNAPLCCRSWRLSRFGTVTTYRQAAVAGNSCSSLRKPHHGVQLWRDLTQLLLRTATGDMESYALRPSSDTSLGTSTKHPAAGAWSVN